MWHHSIFIIYAPRNKNIWHKKDHFIYVEYLFNHRPHPSLLTYSIISVTCDGLVFWLISDEMIININSLILATNFRIWNNKKMLTTFFRIILSYNFLIIYKFISFSSESIQNNCGDFSPARALVAMLYYYIFKT